jgi:preprotein translocase subunit SecE
VVNKAVEFLGNVKVELKKVTWPSKRDAYGSTVAVIVLVLGVTIFLWGVDKLLSSAIGMLLRG